MGVAWGGTNTLAQALLHASATRTRGGARRAVARLRVYTISDQDDAGPWIRREFPALHYVAMPSTPDGDQYYLATWTGISGDRFYRNAPGADFTTFTDAWIDANIRSKGPLGKHYPMPCCIHEGDTPSFLGLINNGLASFMSPAYGGWGGRTSGARYFGEPRPSWTQGGDSFRADNSRDTVIGADGRTTPRTRRRSGAGAPRSSTTSPRGWTGRQGAGEANHNPRWCERRREGAVPIDATPASRSRSTPPAPATPTATRSYRWFFYPRSGQRHPGRPVSPAGRRSAAAATQAKEASLRSRRRPAEPPPRVTLTGESTARVR